MSYKKPVHNLDIGSHVVCVEVFSSKYNANDSRQHRVRTPYRTDPRHGWLVGWRTIATDWSVQFGSYSYEEYEPNCVSQINKKERVAMVLFWPTQKPRYIPIDAVCLHDEATHGPFLPTSGIEWTEHDKQNMREWSKDFPRDEHGRFCKKKIS